MDKEVMKGSIDILLLSIIEQQDIYGYKIIQHLRKKSNDAYRMSQGTLYPALQRLEKKGWITSYWGEAETGARRKFYCITENGKKELDKKLKSWQQISYLIQCCKGGFA
ncbi:PadR family transcriptional regulator [Aneurinibacillus danicus]|jgi:transcriptional regulator|uniref:PadR family transcriptional regulator n=1 Tax=Aneurinibacillus danicus TaxID=267746 RepID=A0A511V942_9BACL|nr:PadR family transcriptional regulator [Aneurinibacillus danicus]GEN34741.1 PadR family transcriptional regulator [Aneurinibacillus danicus]